MKPEKNLSDPKIKLYRLVALVRELHPNQRSENPYQAQMQSYVHQMDVEEQILLHNLIHSLTLLNAPSRKKEKQVLYSTQNDNLNALELMKNPEEKLNLQALEMYQQLEQNFGYEPFTKEEALEKLSIKNRTFTYRAKSLKAHQMLSYIGIVQRSFGKTSLYQLLNNHLKFSQAKTEDVWEEITEEYQEFKGFVDLEYRTDYSPYED